MRISTVLEPHKFRWVVRLYLLAALLGGLAQGQSPARAHDIYSYLTDGNGRSCCHEGDCRPAQYRLSGADVEMLIGDKWIVIPRSKLQYRVLEGDTGETAGGHWCGSPDESTSFFTYCAIMPPSLAMLMFGIPSK